MRLLSDLRAIRSNRPLTALIAASAISSFGDWLYLAALPIIVFQETQDPALLGAVAAGRLMPFLLLSVPAGFVADRFSRRRILLATESIRALLMFAMAAAYVSEANVVILIAIALCSAALGTFAMPAQGALMPELAREENELGLANASSAALDNIASIAGPAVAGLLVLTSGLAAASAINGVTFLCVVALLMVTRTHPDAQPDPGTMRRAGGPDPATGAPWGSIGPPTLRATLLDAAVSFAAGALGVMPIVIAVEHLRVGEALAGLIGAAGGIGATLGGVAAASVLGKRPSTVVTVGGLGIAAALLLVALVPSSLVAVAGIAVALAAVVLLDTLNLTWLQGSVPASHLGRALGVVHTSAAVWLMVGSAVPPILAAAFGSVVAIQAIGFGSLGLVALSMAADVALRAHGFGHPSRRQSAPGQRGVL